MCSVHRWCCFSEQYKWVCTNIQESANDAKCSESLSQSITTEKMQEATPMVLRDGSYCHRNCTKIKYQPRVTTFNSVRQSWVPWSVCKMGVQVIEKRAHMPLYGYLLPSLFKHGTGNFLTTQPIFQPGSFLFPSVLTTKAANEKQTICKWLWGKWDGACMTGFTHKQKSL